MDPVSQPTLHLVNTPLFSRRLSLSGSASARRSYERAKAIGLSYGLSIDDVGQLSDKFWALHRDQILSIDGATLTILTIHYNLAAGTLTRYLLDRSDLKGLLNEMLAWRVVGQFCLTELGHGLDIANLETTAELLPDGTFCLNTPSLNAAKFMPPTVPIGIPCIALVWARLKVGSDDRGIRPFIVPVNDGYSMSPGVTSKLLPHRSGGRPVNHSLTYFKNVVLPHSAMLGTPEFLPRLDFMASLARVTVGSIALGVTSASALHLYATIGARYSLRRTILGSSPIPTPIFDFRTQQIPVLTALAQAHVMSAYDKWTIRQFRGSSADLPVKQGIAACFKAVAVQLSLAANLAVSERCGAQGVFEHNQMSAVFTTVRGIAIAEGDILTVSIRLATELLLGRYNLPAPLDDRSVLAQHELSLVAEAKEMLSALSSHRSDDYNRLLLPLCRPLVEAIGHRMAYDAAVSAHVPQCLVALYVASIVKLDPAWYAEVGGISRKEQLGREDSAIGRVLPRLEEFLRESWAEPYVTAPIVSDEKWGEFVGELAVFGGGMGEEQLVRAHL